MTGKELVNLFLFLVFFFVVVFSFLTCFVLEMLYEMERSATKPQGPVCVHRLEVRKYKTSYLQAKQILL